MSTREHSAQPPTGPILPRLNLGRAARAPRISILCKYLLPQSCLFLIAIQNDQVPSTTQLGNLLNLWLHMPTSRSGRHIAIVKRSGYNLRALTASGDV